MELYKNTEWKKVAIGNEYINIPLDVERETLIKLITKIKDGTHDSFKDAKDSDYDIVRGYLKDLGQSAQDFIK